MTDAIITIVTIIGTAAVVLALIYAGYTSGDKLGECDDACGHVRSRLIDGVCHCATDSGYVRSEGLK